MDPSVAQGLAGFSLVIVFFGLLLAVLWILVPFAIFGIKPLLRQLVSHLVAVEKQNAEMLVALRDARQAPVVVRDDRPIVS
jgi:hypothetical protein